MTRVVLALVLLAGCLEPDLVSCADGRLCPQSTMCDLVHHQCITTDQQQACDGLVDDAICNVHGAVGACSGGVCLLSVCGDGAIGPHEVCDDGNRTNGDGCNSTCTSDERCGNGIVDPEMGEQCDDGNMISGDGCDSRCRSEQESWTVEGVSVLYDAELQTVYDPVRHQAIHVADGLTWTWDGTMWSVLASTGLPSSQWAWYRLVWDSDRDHVLLVGSLYPPPNFVCPCAADQIWSWDGTSWTQIAVNGNPPAFTIAYTTYDRARHVVLAIGYSNNFTNTMSFDPVTATWSTLVAVPGTSGQLTIAYDVARDVAVLAIGSETQEWNGTSWATFNVAAPANTQLTYDPMLGAVVAVGAAGIATWSGGQWHAVDTSAIVGATPDLWFDDDRQRLVAVTQSNDVYEDDGSQWSGPLQSAPILPAGSSGPTYDTYDLTSHELVVLPTDGSNAWTYDGHWRPLAPQPNATAFSYPQAIAYDPVRGGTVVREDDGSTWLLQGQAWSQLLPADSLYVQGPAIFDPSRRALVVADDMLTSQLASDGTQWTQLAPASESLYLDANIVFDARSNQLLVAASGMTQELEPSGWNAGLSAVNVVIAADQRRGTVELVGPTHSYERVDEQWFERGSTPLTVDGTTVYAPDTGTLYVIGIVGAHSSVMLERRFVGPSPIDACTGHDDDGDGLVDCADPECWWACTPACPPYATCP